MSAFVLDASVAGRWVFGKDVARPLCDLRLAALMDGVSVPVLFRFEVANMLTQWARHVDGAQALVCASELSLVPSVEDGNPCSSAALMELALETGLSGYDAAYLELAERLELPLATVDAKLAAAARARGVMVVP